MRPARTRKSTYRLATYSACALLSAATWCGPAQAKDPVKENSVDPRRQANTSNVAAEIETSDPQGDLDDEARVSNAYKPKGLELGSFVLFPDLSIGEGYSSNIYATENDEHGDFVTRIAPKLQARSRFDRHMLNFTAEAEQLLYKEYTDDNETNGRVSTDGRLDIGSSSELSGMLSAYRAHEDRSSPDSADSKEPTAYNGIDASAEAKTVEGRWVYSLGGGYHLYDYEDGSTSTGTNIDNDIRDRSIYDARGRIAYELFPGYFAVTQLSANTRQYDQSENAGGYDRSSNGYAGQVGLGVDLTRLIRGDFLVGYFSQDYDDPALEDPSGLSIQSVFNWTPSRSTLVVASLSRDVEETTNTTATAIVRSSGSVLVRHELRRNIILSASGRVTYDDYDGLDSSSTTYVSRGSVTYALNSNVYTSAELSYTHRDVDGTATNPYDDTVAGIRIGYRM